MNIIHTARTALGLTQAEFGAWLAERMGRDRPIPDYRISEWERGVRSPRRNVREICAPIAADEVASDAVIAVCGTLHRAGIDLLDAALSPEMLATKNKIKTSIEELIS